jgi:UDP-2-acetamido-2,6-beta-L-arabino-hexul-4-ose reductase
MRVLITGSNGFIGKNLQKHLLDRNDIFFKSFTSNNSLADLPIFLKETDLVFHLAGVNRPQNVTEFQTGNEYLTQKLCEFISEINITENRKIPIIFSSSIQAKLNNEYGESKKNSEFHLLNLKKNHKNPVYIFRLPNVFGKWNKPDYNSVVATFCHNISRNLPIQVRDLNATIRLVYIDDVINCFIRLMDSIKNKAVSQNFPKVSPQYSISLGELVALLQNFKNSQNTLMLQRVGLGLERALYSTYMSYVPVESFDYRVPQYSDSRGVFVEMVKTLDCGQFSYFTSHPGVTRGGHYHHSKIEKFLMIKGHALFRFRNIITGQYYEIESIGGSGHIVETVPGWTHDITNIGEEELICAIWANEIFNRSKPDTFSCPI